MTNFYYKLKNFIFKQIYRIYKPFWKNPGYYKVNGGKVYLSPEDGLSSWKRRFGCWEPEFLNQFDHFFHPGDKVIQIGSCMGDDTLLIAKLVGNNGQVLGIEPFPRYYGYLEKTLAANPQYSKTLRFANIGYSNTPKSITFESVNPYEALDQLNNIDYSSRESARKITSQTIKVNAISLKEIVDTYNIVPTVMFFDIEGGELMLFDELENLEIRPNLLWEHHAHFYTEETLEKYLKKLEALGYKNSKITVEHYFSEFVK